MRLPWDHAKILKKTPHCPLRGIFGALGLWLLITYFFPRQRPDYRHLQTNRSKSDDNEHYDMSSIYSADCNSAKAVYEKKGDPQLSDLQIMWVSEVLHATRFQNKKPSNLLVFGVGNDSPMWKQINCNGRTVFIEDDLVWMEKVSSAFPELEVHKVDYKSSVMQANEFFQNPSPDFHIDSTVDSECFDVILIDAPKGYTDEHPGRMIPAYWSDKKAKGCLQQENQVTVVFLHDIKRPGEQAIMKHCFLGNDGWHHLGIVEGPFGDLSGWVLYRQNIEIS